MSSFSGVNKMGSESNKVEESFEERIRAKLACLHKSCEGELYTFDIQLEELTTIHYRLFGNIDDCPGIGISDRPQNQSDGFCAEILNQLNVLQDYLILINHDNQRLRDLVSTLKTKLFMSDLVSLEPNGPK